MGATLADPVASALFPRSRRAVLGILYGDPESRYYLREIIEMAGLGSGQVECFLALEHLGNTELTRLSEAGIIRRFKEGRHVYFQANPACPVYDELRSLVTRSLGAGAVVSNSLEALADRIQVAFVYGSVARGEERSESDIDLLVVGDVSFGELVEALAGAESQLRREIHPTVFSLEEFRARLARHDHFVNSVVKEEKIFVIGDEDELRNLLAQPVD